MREAVLLPQYGMGMTECQLIEWLKQPGDAVTEDQPIAVVEAAKVEAELVAPYTGTLVEIVAEPGQIVDVGEVVAWLEV